MARVGATPHQQLPPWLSGRLRSRQREVLPPTHSASLAGEQDDRAGAAGKTDLAGTRCSGRYQDGTRTAGAQ